MNFASWVAIGLCAWAIVAMFAMALCRAAAEGDRKSSQAARGRPMPCEPDRVTGIYTEAS